MWEIVLGSTLRTGSLAPASAIALLSPGWSRERGTPEAVVITADLGPLFL